MSFEFSRYATFLLVALSYFLGTTSVNVVQGFVTTSNWASAARHQQLQQNSPFSLLLRASPSSTTRTKTKKKAPSSSGKKAKTARRRGAGGEKIQAISEQELVDHVSSMYMRPDRTPANAETSASDAGQRLSRFPALVLNADYQPMRYLPLSLWNWQDAIKAVFSGKVTVVDVYPDTVVRAASLEIPLPSVIALNDYVPHLADAAPAFTRRNVFLRDGYRCQYCARAFHPRDLSLDHVVPRSRGGRLQWTNAVTCCRRCNGRKGSLLPHQLAGVGMALRAPPRWPSQHQLARRAGQMLPRRRVHPTWEPYLEAVGVAAAAASRSREESHGNECGGGGDDADVQQHP